MKALLEVLKGEAIDGSPEGGEHGDGEKKKTIKWKKRCFDFAF
jgi:hypothetical protein